MRTLNKLLPVLSIIALAGILACALALLGGNLSREASHWGMLIATIVWFLTAPFWIGRSSDR